MGGEIGIMEKEVGERGTCFRFNVLLSASESESGRAAESGANGGDSFQLWGRVQSPKAERSRVILMVGSGKRSSVVQAFMQRLGIKVQVVKQQEQLGAALKQTKRKLNMWSYSSENSRSDGCGSRTSSNRSVPLSALDGVDEPHHPRPNAEAGFVLMVIDTRVGVFEDMRKVIGEFRRDLRENWYSRVVWLDSSTNNFDEDKLAAPDLVISKPFHGSRLYQTIALLPEFGGIPPRRGEVSLTSSSRNNVCVESSRNQTGETESDYISPLMGKRILVVDDDPVGRKIATSVASQLGAISFYCENGAQACQLVCKCLEGEPSSGTRTDSVRFDCILMDCEVTF